MRGPNPTTTRFSRRQRRDATGAERKLWTRLRNRQLANLKFVRQEPIGPYTADFCCREAKLIVEVDGGQHAESKRDARRDAWLAEQGYHVLRLWNVDVLMNTDGVLEAILATLFIDPASPERSWRPYPSPCPLPASRGEERFFRRC